MESARIEAEDFDAVQDLFHAKGWTDGLPVVPPTPERVAQFLAAAGLKPDHQLGFYEERRVPVFAEKVAINAVMAGCLPEYFPVVVAIIEAMLEPGFPIHVANSSTGSFTLGFLVNGPIRNAIGMNCHGNVLGPGNRANSSIGRAVRLIQLNVLGSIPGAGAPDPAHGRAVLDRSMMGQPAKYAGYHIVENEEEFPSLTPTHVELGFAPGDSTVTLFLTAGYHWTDCHGEQTPEEWIETMAQYVVGTGKLTAAGFGMLLLPPENAQLFVSNGWSKDDIRKALFEKTKRSVAWVKESGFKVRFHRPRCEPVNPGDEDSIMAMSATPDADSLYVVVCGGIAGSWPYFLYGAGGPGSVVTKKVRWQDEAPDRVIKALEPLKAMLAADDYHLALSDGGAGVLLAEIRAGPDACADCLVPKPMMRGYFDKALRESVGADAPEVRLIYPAENA